MISQYMIIVVTFFDLEGYEHVPSVILTIHGWMVQPDDSTKY